MSMIIGLAIAGSIVMLSGNKDKKPPEPTLGSTEFVVRVGDGNVAVTPKS
ncbi:hypothetical protein [Leptothoe sp. PORK10 BA2]|nr:hypothetical protein [Leptothoe sp. PORK10 BA2]MEA5462299.1 hypothetical protein [Leptothoe sp. PORK10 BA2]